jgi:hypothetical protein
MGRNTPRRTRIKEFTDGTAKTMLISEKIIHPDDNLEEHRGDFMNDDGGGNIFATINGPNSSDVDYMKRTTYCFERSLLPCAGGPDTIGYYQSVRSLHIGGVLCGMGDGSVHFVSENIAISNWQGLSMMNDGKIIASIE